MPLLFMVGIWKYPPRGEDVVDCFLDGDSKEFEMKIGDRVRHILGWEGRITKQLPADHVALYESPHPIQEDERWFEFYDWMTRRSFYAPEYELVLL